MELIALSLLGLIAGSFINAWLWRVKVGKKVSQGRSECPHCHHQLTAPDLIPVASWLMLGGHCRYCHKPISVSYPIVELLTGILFAASWIFFQPLSLLEWLSFAVWLYLLVSLIFLAIYDLRWLLLPDRALLPAMAVAILWLLLRLAIGEISLLILLAYTAAAFIAAAVFYALAAVSDGKWLGGGDIKLVFLMGLLLGPSKLMVALFLAFTSAAVIGVALIAMRRKGRRDHIAFGPFLIAGILVALFWGQNLIDFYLGLSNLGLIYY